MIPARQLGKHAFEGDGPMCLCGHDIRDHIFEVEDVNIAGWWGKPERYTTQYISCYVDDCDFPDGT